MIEIRRRIAEIQPAGGYIAITGAAGQGKSSIIAKLVKEYESENVASHFILFNSGPDYQITLLKHLMAHLIRKYRFSDLYIATASLPALHEYFSIMLRKIAEWSGHEVIFIDGFEQPEEMQAEMYDISFLPHNPPPGIVLVLGIRSENTLKFFEISKPHHEYHLPDLNRPDFESILQHHHIQLEREQVNQLYHATHGNPLYLDLTIEELKTQGIAAIGEIIVLITNHLENLYALAVTRLEQPHEEWDKVLKTLLGVFMVAREPLSEQSICQILNIEVDRLKIGLRRLDRLVVKNSQNRYALFHSEIHKYLHRDKRFSALEWHKKFAEWCEGDSITTIWKDSNDLIEQQRQVYARQHYITHLYYARDQLGIFQVLDVGEYGQAKIQYLNPGSILYTRDLDLGKHASVWKSRIGEEQGRTLKDQITQLPHLWRYSLLRCSLINGERQYPDGVFRLLVLLKREKEALQLAELLTDPILKAEALLAIAKQMLEQPELGSECLNILTRAYTVVDAIKENIYQCSAILLELGQILTQAQEWERAKSVWDVKSPWDKVEQMIDPLKDHEQRDKALWELGRIMAQVRQWTRARQVIDKIHDRQQKVYALLEVGRALAREQELVRAKTIWGDARSEIGYIRDSEQQSKVLRELGQLFTLSGLWDEAEQVIDTIRNNKLRTEALRELGRALAQEQKWERAETVWGKAKQAMEAPQDIAQRVKVLNELGRALTQAQHRERAEAVWDEAERLVNTLPEAEKYEALLELSKALAQSQRRERADKIIHLISEKQLVEAPLELLQVLIQAQQWDQAQSIIDGLKEREGHAEAVLNLVRGLVASKRWRHAERAIKDIDIEKDEKQYTEAVRVLWKAFIQEQQWEKAQQLIETIQDTEQGAEALCELGEALAQAKQKKQAETSWTKIQRSMKTSQDSEPRDEVIYMLAQALTQKQQWDETRQVIDSIQDIEWKIEAFYMLAQALTNAEQFEQAQNIWDDVEQVVTNIPDLNQRNTAAKDFVHALTVTHQWERAERIAGMIGDGEQRNEALEELEEAKKLSNTSKDEEYEASQELEGVENREQIRPFQEKAEETKDTNEDPEKHIQVLSDLKLRNIRDQKREQVEELSGRRQRDRQKNIFLDKLARALQTQQWEQAEQVIESFLDDRQKNTALGELAGALAQAQQWKQAEQVINRIPNNKQRNAALNELGTILATTNEFEELLHLVQRTWLQIETREDAIALLPLAVGLISLEPDIGIEFCKAFDWVDDFLVG